MLVLSGIEIIFFIVASMGLCCWFVLETVDNAEMFLLLLSSAYTVFSTSYTILPISRLGMYKKLGGDTVGTADSN